MSYKTLYRTYRPRAFSEVVGQEHITRTFKNALEKDKIAHAYLFTGPRGTGKTSVAKIIAKAVNCKEAPTSEPCNHCESCNAINNGTDSDCIEIDAASNNGVDEIREIRDKVKYAPTAGRFKVYIIDEVHMLSTGAFNALLKTLEEPPAHVIFILATTEPHKIPATIISRCQRFDFKSISVKDIVGRIKYIVNKENIEIEEKAILAIASNAEGGMRDALSILDQAISYSDEAVTEANVHEITGTVSENDIANLVEALSLNNTEEAVKMIDRLISLGKEPLRLLENIIYYFRDLFLIKKLDQIDGELVYNHSEKTQELAKMISVQDLSDIISVLNNAQYEMRKTNYPRVFIELAVFEIADKLNGEKQPAVIKVQEPAENKAEYKEPEKPKPEPTETVERKFIDVKEIEDILNHADKEKKLKLMLQWSMILGNNLELASIEQMLNDGQVEAVSKGNKILLSYEFDAVCAKLYEPDVYQKAVGILETVFNEKYTVLALPRRIWNAKKEEYVTQFKNKIKQPKLTPITEPILVKKNNDKYEFEPELVKEAVNLFGEDIVNIK